MGFATVMQKGRKAARTIAAGGVIALSSLLPMKEGRANDVFNAKLRLPVGHVDTTFSLTRNEFTASVRIVADVDTSEAKAGLKVSHTEVSVPILYYWNDTATVAGVNGSTKDSTTYKGVIRYFTKDTVDLWAADTMYKNRHFVFVNGKPMTDVYGNDSLATRDSTTFSNYTATITNFSKGHDNTKDLFYSKGNLVFNVSYTPPIGLTTQSAPPQDTVLWLAPGIGLVVTGVKPDVKINLDVVQAMTGKVYGSSQNTTFAPLLRVKAEYADSGYNEMMGVGVYNNGILDRYVFAQEFLCQIKIVKSSAGQWTNNVWYKADKAEYLGGVPAWPGDTTYHVANSDGYWSSIDMYARPPPYLDHISRIYLNLYASNRTGTPPLYVFYREDKTNIPDWMVFQDNGQPYSLSYDSGKFRTYRFDGSNATLLGKYTDRTDTNGFRMRWTSPTHGEITLVGHDKLTAASVVENGPLTAKAMPSHKWVKPTTVVAEGQAPKEFEMSGYPNPTSGWVSLEFEQARAGHATIRVRDALGRVVQTEHSDWLVDGKQHVAFQLNSDLPSGIYTIETGGKTVREVLAH